MSIQVISFHCILKNKLGQVLSSTYNQDILTVDIHGQQPLLKGLSEGLRSLQPGEKRRISLSAPEAYGFYNLDKVMVRSREDFPENLQIGDQIALKTENGKSNTFRVTHMTEETVELDGNHPLAGQDLIFEIEALKVRPATREEIEEAHERSLFH